MKGWLIIAVASQNSPWGEINASQKGGMKHTAQGGRGKGGGEGKGIQRNTNESHAAADLLVLSRLLGYYC